MPGNEIDIRVKAKDEASDVIEGVAKSGEQMGKKLADVGSKMSARVTAPILALGAASFKMA